MPEIPDPAAATNVFARPIECDGHLYRELLTRPDRQCFSAVVELGAGTGRLTAVWLELELRVVALEVDPRLREALERRFPDAISSGQLVVLPHLANYSVFPTNAAFVAPYNVAYYFSSPVAFAAACRPALAAGMTIYFDVTDVSAPSDGLPPSGRLRSRRVGAFREDVIGEGDGAATVAWFHYDLPVMRFVLHSHAPRDLLRAITSIRPNSIIRRAATGLDEQTPFAIFEIAPSATPNQP